MAAGEMDGAHAAVALERLCQTYWSPLYAYLRRRGYSEHDAEDLTQGFFAHLLERRTLARIDREKGRFRSFLLASMNYFLANERDRAMAQKRGGGRTNLSLDAEEGEESYRLEPADNRTPEMIFEHRWAMTLLDQVLARLSEEFNSAGKGALFQKLQPFLVEGTGEDTYANVAGQIGLSEEAFKKAVQRMRRRYHDLFREEIAHTVTTSDEVEEELRHLSSVLSN